MAESSYGQERQLELRALCDPFVAGVLREEQVSLQSFAEI